MNKQELISAAAEKTGFSKKDTEATVTAVLETIISALEDNEKVQQNSMFLLCFCVGCAIFNKTAPSDPSR